MTGRPEPVAGHRPDPAPATQDAVPWWYPYGEYELAVLARVLREGFAANRHVDYSPNAGVVAGAGRFRHAVARPGRLTVVTSGTCAVVVDGRPVGETAAGPVTVTVPAGAREVVAEVSAPPGVPAALAVTDGAAVLGDPAWLAWTERWGWGPAGVRPGTANLPAHDMPSPVTTIVAHAADGLVELSAPVLGRPVLGGATAPRVASGESLAEALAGGADAETRHDVVQRSDGLWTTQHALGFRYLRVEPPVTGPVPVEVPTRPAQPRGSFRCSDDVLTRIWDVSADTLALCLQDLVVDGIKRDRMPWAGDLATATLSSAYALGPRAAVRDTWVALGQPRYGHVNGIGDYTLWWLVAAGSLVRHVDVAGELAQVAAHVHRVLGDLLPEVGDDGVFRPRTHPGQFARVFLDWGVTVDEDRDLTALQMLWSWALTSAAGVLAAAGHPAADRWAALARTLAATVRATAWEPRTRTWREYLGPSDPATPHANALAVLAGRHEGPADRVRDVLRDAHVGTPFMTGFALRALGLAGGRHDAVARVRRLWGSMLDRGARTFWEDFPGEGDDTAMYGRPFGRSLCHGWASGPAALLPELVLGIRSAGDGWSAVTVDPDLGDLTWAEAVVPLPGGDLVVRADPGGLAVDVPPGTTLVRPDGDRGPGRHRLG